MSYIKKIKESAQCLLANVYTYFLECLKIIKINKQAVYRATSNKYTAY